MIVASDWKEQNKITQVCSPEAVCARVRVGMKADGRGGPGNPTPARLGVRGQAHTNQHTWAGVP